MVEHETESLWRVCLPPVLVLGTPWLVAAIVIAIWYVFPYGSIVGRWLSFADVGFVLCGCAYGASFVRGRLPVRLAAIVAIVFYGIETYLILLILALNLVPPFMR